LVLLLLEVEYRYLSPLAPAPPLFLIKLNKLLVTKLRPLFFHQTGMGEWRLNFEPKGPNEEGGEHCEKNGLLPAGHGHGLGFCALFVLRPFFSAHIHTSL
jgi:hypothetical protein